MIARALLGLLLITVLGCGKKDDAKTKTPPAPAPEAPAANAPADPAPAAAADLAPKGADVDRLCTWYGDAWKERAEMGGGEPAGDPVATCKQTMAKRSAEDRQKIADCANACGDMDSVVDCFDDFGEDSFPACEPEAGDDDDDDDE